MNINEFQHIEKHNNAILQRFIDRYSKTKKPVEVSFRELFPDVKNNDRYTHLIHPYPAKLLFHIPYLFVNNTLFSKPGDYVLDPFAGTGTVLLEALLAKRNAYGADANPLARLISEVKISTFEIDELKRVRSLIVKRAQLRKVVTTPSVVNCEYWFTESTIQTLSRIYSTIDGLKNDKIKKFMLVAFSNCVRKVSLADTRISVPVKLNPAKYPVGSAERKRITQHLQNLASIDIYSKFEEIVNANITRQESLQLRRTGKYLGNIISTDARRLTKKLNSNSLLPRESIQLIISSPPYAGAQKYIRASSLSLGWTNLAGADELLALDGLNIGRENFRKADLKVHKSGLATADKLIELIYQVSPTRATIVGLYLTEMLDALSEMVRVLKKGGTMVIIIGNNKVCGYEFNMQSYITEFLTKKKNLSVQLKLIDDIRSYGLMTKRNKTADIISREWILVFKK